MAATGLLSRGDITVKLCKCVAGFIAVTSNVWEAASVYMARTQSRSALRLLIVDDDAAAVTLLKEAFTCVEVSHRIDCVCDGDEALEFVHKRGRYADAPTPDLVLLDLNMPKSTGFDVLCDVKADPELRQVIVIVFSTSTENRDVMKAYNCRANCYIGKPLDLSGYFRLADGIANFGSLGNTAISIRCLVRMRQAVIGAPRNGYRFDDAARGSCLYAGWGNPDIVF